MRSKKNIQNLNFSQGAKTVEEGAYFSNEESWKQVLRKIYSNLIDTLITNKRRQNRHKGSLVNYILPLEVIDLAAQVGGQIFAKKDQDCRVDLTQVVPMDVTQVDER